MVKCSRLGLSAAEQQQAELQWCPVLRLLSLEGVALSPGTGVAMVWGIFEASSFNPWLLLSVKWRDTGRNALWVNSMGSCPCSGVVTAAGIHLLACKLQEV